MQGTYTFAKSKGNLETALRGYKELNLRALKMLRPGGVLHDHAAGVERQSEMHERLDRADGEPIHHLRLHVLRTLEHDVLEEVGKSGPARLLPRRAHVVPRIDRDQRDAGQAGELTGTTRPW